MLCISAYNYFGLGQNGIEKQQAFSIINFIETL